MKILIEVTESDIREGCRANCRRCPISKALKRAFDYEDLQVGAGYLWVSPIDCRKKSTFDLPQIAVDFISNFDCQMGVEPISFEIETDDFLA